MKTRLGSTLNGLLAIKNRSQHQYAEEAGISQGQINNITRGARPSPETLRKLCAPAAWNGDPIPGIELIIDHLRDEAARAGRNEELIITPTAGRPASTADLLNNVERLVSIIPSAAEPLADIIGYMLQGVTYQTTEPPLSLVAEPTTPYKTTKKESTPKNK